MIHSSILPFHFSPPISCWQQSQGPAFAISQSASRSQKFYSAVVDDGIVPPQFRGVARFFEFCSIVPDSLRPNNQRYRFNSFRWYHPGNDSQWNTGHDGGHYSADSRRSPCIGCRCNQVLSKTRVQRGVVIGLEGWIHNKEESLSVFLALHFSLSVRILSTKTLEQQSINPSYLVASLPRPFQRSTTYTQQIQNEQHI